jgi:hypothetical protein
MASAGTVTVDFAAETAKFTAELKKVRSDLAAVKSSTDSVSESLKTFGGLLAGYVSFRAVVGVVREIVDATSEAQAAQAQLNNALAAAKAPVSAASAEFQAFATDLQKTTTFSDEAVQNVETLLLSFGGLSGHVVKEATTAVLDLSTRMGIDAPAAAKLLGKALSDPEEGLTRLARAGVTFTAAQKEQIKAMQDAGDKAGAQGVILKTLEDRFGGAAAAARDTFGGAIKGLKNAFGDLLEGGNGIDAAATSINHLTEVLSSPEIKTAFGELIADLAKVISLAAQAAAGLAILFTGHGGNESVDIDLQIEKLEKEREALQRGPTQEEMTGPMMEVYSEDRFKADQARIAEIDKQLRGLRTLQDQLLGLGDYGPGGALADVTVKAKRIQPKGALDFTTPDAPGKKSKTADEIREDEANITLATAARAAALTAIVSDQAEKDQQTALDSLKTISKAGMKASDEMAGDELKSFEFSANLRDQGLVLDQMAADERVKIAKEAQDQLNQFLADGLNAAISLHASSDKKVRAIAKAAFLAQKAQAIASTIINTEEAVMTTYAKLGYPLGIPAAAIVAGLGAVQVAAIAGQSIDGGHGSISGGSSAPSIGTPNNPVFTQEGSGESRGVASQTVVNLTITNTGYLGQDMLEQLVDQLREYFDRDGTIINVNSRQAMDIAGLRP